MTSPARSDRRHQAAGQTAAKARTWLIPTIVVLAVLALAVGIAASVLNEPEKLVSDAKLPNPMGGLAYPAPGEVSGEMTFGGVTVTGTQVDMGEVPNGATFVPQWELVNDSEAAVKVTVGQPQVLEGCCPGPVYIDGKLREPGDEVTLPAGHPATVQFPLQMHEGMDGPHHLTVPMTVGDELGELHVTGMFGQM